MLGGQFSQEWANSKQGVPIALLWLRSACIGDIVAGLMNLLGVSTAFAFCAPASALHGLGSLPFIFTLTDATSSDSTSSDATISSLHHFLPSTALHAVHARIPWLCRSPPPPFLHTSVSPAQQICSSSAWPQPDRPHSCLVLFWRQLECLIRQLEWPIRCCFSGECPFPFLPSHAHLLLAISCCRGIPAVILLNANRLFFGKIKWNGNSPALNDADK